MAYNNSIQPSRPNITEILMKMRSSEYYVDRSFQRRLVWTEKQKVRLVETVLMQFPMPEIYLWEQEPDTDTGQQRFSIVDGQQRLSTLREFTSNEWPLKSIYLDGDHKNQIYANQYWKDLPAELRAILYQYNINVRRIPSDVPEQGIRRIFARLNETDRSLNPQELRHATLNGVFLSASLKIADSKEMKRLQIFTKGSVRRMGDVEFASQLLGYERRGITNDTPESMNELYSEFSDNYVEEIRDTKKVIKSLELISETFQDAPVKRLFETQNYVYTLHCLFDVMPDHSVETWRVLLTEFANAYSEILAGQADVRKTDKDLLSFRQGATSRTRSKTSRTQRLFGLKNWIVRSSPSRKLLRQ